MYSGYLVSRVELSVKRVQYLFKKKIQNQFQIRPYFMKFPHWVEENIDNYLRCILNSMECPHARFSSPSDF